MKLISSYMYRATFYEVIKFRKSLLFQRVKEVAGVVASENGLKINVLRR